MIILVLLSWQPVTEILNHYLFPKYGEKVIGLGHAHIWIGRIVITLGMIQGGLGFVFADTIPYQPVWPVAPKIVYGLLAGIVWITYFAICGVMQQMKDVRRRQSETDGGEFGAEEMEDLKGRASAEAQAQGTGSSLDVNGDGGNRRASPRPTDPGFRSSAL
jgi:hypothetical protein